MSETKYVIHLNQITMRDIDIVGGKNASLGEMISKLNALGISVPDGFATTSTAFFDFLAANDLKEKINHRLENLDIGDVAELKNAGADIRGWIRQADFTPVFENQIKQAIDEFAGDDISYAVRSSATAEDLPDASFAGQQETFLNVKGHSNILIKIKEVFASLYNDRAIAYRVHKGFDHSKIALSACVQRMIRSDLGSSGVMFSIDTETGFEGVVLITSGYGLGETIVQGSVNPDEFYVSKKLLKDNKPAIISRSLGSKKIKMQFTGSSSDHDQSVQVVEVEEDQQRKFSIDDRHLLELARQALIIEEHYGKPMDMEWAYDGLEKKIYIVQARPETVQARLSGQTIERYQINTHGKLLISGAAIGHRIGSGQCKVVTSAQDMHMINEGDVLVTVMTDPDWEPIMKKASAIVTDSGGRTCHAAIIARELGVPAIVGCEKATEVLTDNQLVTVSCAEGEQGNVYEGELDYKLLETDIGDLPELPVRIMMNVGNPARAMSFAGIPNDGVGLARLEFIINNKVGIHPKALLAFDLLDNELKEKVSALTYAYPSPTEFYRQKIIEGISTIASVFDPKPVIVRCSDFKSNEYANLLGGELYEPHEENPMIGLRGTSRYLAEQFQDCFAMECQALKYVRDEMGLTNVWIMAPFVRTLQEADQLIKLFAKNGLVRGVNDLKLLMMCEIPSNAILAEQFLEYFDGFSIGSNDMTQLTLGLDRDSSQLSYLFDERDDAVKYLLKRAIDACNQAGKYIGICGQGPSDHPDFAQWLLDSGIGSISLNPDSVVDTIHALSKLSRA